MCIDETIKEISEEEFEEYLFKKIDEVKKYYESLLTTYKDYLLYKENDKYRIKYYKLGNACVYKPEKKVFGFIKRK